MRQHLWFWVPLAGAVLFASLVILAVFHDVSTRAAARDTITLYACGAPMRSYQASDIDVHRDLQSVWFTTSDHHYVEWAGVYEIVGETP